MAVALVHFEFENQPQWGVLFAQHIAPVASGARTTGEVLDRHWDEIWAQTPSDARIALSAVKLLSPVTRNQQFLCQGINYASHVRESGMDPKAIAFNTIQVDVELRPDVVDRRLTLADNVLRVCDSL